MIILDENIPEGQARLLAAWHIACKQIGRDVGRKGAEDDAILPLLHQLRRATFITRDAGFFDASLCHQNYCIVVMDVAREEVAVFARRVLKHSAFNTKVKRMGIVMRVSHTAVRVWRRGSSRQRMVGW